MVQHRVTNVSTLLNPGCRHHVELFPDPSCGTVLCHRYTQRRQQIGQRQRSDPQRTSFITPGSEAVMVQGEKIKSALCLLLCLVCSASKASLRLVCGFYGLCLHTEVWLQPAGSTAVLEVGIEEKKTSSLFTSALQSLETHSSQQNTLCVCVCTWPSCLALCSLSSCPLLQLSVSFLSLF